MGEKFFQFCPARNDSLFRAGGSSRMRRGIERASTDRESSLSGLFCFRDVCGEIFILPGAGYQMASSRRKGAGLRYAETLAPAAGI